jgi:anthranilate phosphoribosyltransferase
VSELAGGTVNTFYVHPADAGLSIAPVGALAGGSAAENAAMVERVLAGETGARRDVVLLNAAAGLLVAGCATSLADGVLRAAESIDRGHARAALNCLREVCAS